MATAKEIKEFLKNIYTARECTMLSECEETLKHIDDFTGVHKMPFSIWPKNLKTRYSTICNKRRKIYNQFYKK